MGFKDGPHGTYVAATGPKQINNKARSISKG
jgi:hypothetical protein